MPPSQLIKNGCPLLGELIGGEFKREFFFPALSANNPAFPVFETVLPRLRGHHHHGQQQGKERRKSGGFHGCADELRLALLCQRNTGNPSAIKTSPATDSTVLVWSVFTKSHRATIIN